MTALERRTAAIRVGWYKLFYPVELAITQRKVHVLQCFFHANVRIVQTSGKSQGYLHVHKSATVPSLADVNWQVVMASLTALICTRCFSLSAQKVLRSFWEWHDIGQKSWTSYWDHFVVQGCTNWIARTKVLLHYYTDDFIVEAFDCINNSDHTM